MSCSLRSLSGLFSWRSAKSSDDWREQIDDKESYRVKDVPSRGCWGPLAHKYVRFNIESKAGKVLCVHYYADGPSIKEKPVGPRKENTVCEEIGQANGKYLEDLWIDGGKLIAAIDRWQETPYHYRSHNCQLFVKYLLKDCFHIDGLFPQVSLSPLARKLLCLGRGITLLAAEQSAAMKRAWLKFHGEETTKHFALFWDEDAGRPEVLPYIDALNQWHVVARGWSPIPGILTHPLYKKSTEAGNFDFLTEPTWKNELSDTDRLHNSTIFVQHYRFGR